MVLTNTSVNLRAFNKTATVEKDAKAPAAASAVPMDPSNYSLQPIFSNREILPPRPNVPQPSIDTTIVVPLIFELKAKLAKLEEELYRTNGGQMKQTIEVLLERLASFDLDHAIKALGTLNGILMHLDLVYSYSPYLDGIVDRIVLLCAEQYNYFITVYLKNKKKVPNEIQKVQKLLDLNTQLLSNLLLKCPIQLGTGVSRDALCRLVHSIVPFLAWENRERSTSEEASTVEIYSFHPFGEIRFHEISFLVRDILRSSNHHDDPSQNVSSTRVLLKATLIRLLREFITDDSMKVELDYWQQAIDALNHLIKIYLNDCWHKYDIDVKNEHLKVVVYEIYRLFELSLQFGTIAPITYLPALESAKSYISSIFTQLGPEAAWKHFVLVDKVLTATKSDPDGIALFKYLYYLGYTMPVGNVAEDNPKSSVGIQKSIKKSEPVNSTVEASASVVQLKPEDKVESKPTTAVAAKEELENSFEKIQFSELKVPEVVPQTFETLKKSYKKSQHNIKFKEERKLELLQEKIHDLQLELAELTSEYPHGDPTLKMINWVESKLNRIMRIFHKN